MLSVVVPVYNVSEYIDECVRSLLVQTYKNLEIILVDDGSTDDSGVKCDKIAAEDERVVVYHKDNGGLSSARNFGIEKANGEWVIFVDSDDFIIASDAFGSLVDYAIHYNMDIVKYEYKEVDETGADLYLKDIRQKATLQNRVLTNYDMVKHAIANEWFAVLFLVKKSVLNGLRFDENRKFQEDIDFFVRLFSAGSYNCGYYPERYYAYRKRRESITTTPKLNNIVGSFTLSAVFISAAERLGTSDRSLASLYGSTAVMMYYWTLSTLTESPYSKSSDAIILKLDVDGYRRAAVRYMDTFAVDRKYRLFVRLAPSVALKLIRLKNFVVRTLKRFV